VRKVLSIFAMMAALVMALPASSVAVAPPAGTSHHLVMVVDNPPPIGVFHPCQLPENDPYPCAAIAFPDWQSLPWHVGDCIRVWYNTGHYDRVKGVGHQMKTGEKISGWSQWPLYPVQSGEGTICWHHPGRYVFGIFAWRPDPPSGWRHIRDVARVKILP
jgi:hypothetical protein